MKAFSSCWLHSENVASCLKWNNFFSRYWQIQTATITFPPSLPSFKWSNQLSAMLKKKKKKTLWIRLRLNEPSTRVWGNLSWRCRFLKSSLTATMCSIMAPLFRSLLEKRSSGNSCTAEERRNATVITHQQHDCEVHVTAPPSTSLHCIHVVMLHPPPSLTLEYPIHKSYNTSCKRLLGSCKLNSFWPPTSNF